MLIIVINIAKKNIHVVQMQQETSYFLRSRILKLNYK